MIMTICEHLQTNAIDDVNKCVCPHIYHELSTTLHFAMRMSLVVLQLQRFNG